MDSRLPADAVVFAYTRRVPEWRVWPLRILALLTVPIAVYVLSVPCCPKVWMWSFILGPLLALGADSIASRSTAARSGELDIQLIGSLLVTRSICSDLATAESFRRREVRLPRPGVEYTFTGKQGRWSIDSQDYAGSRDLEAALGPWLREQGDPRPTNAATQAGAAALARMRAEVSGFRITIGFILRAFSVITWAVTLAHAFLILALLVAASILSREARLGGSSSFLAPGTMSATAEERADAWAVRERAPWALPPAA